MPASPSTARAINDRLALRLLQSEGPLTAGQLKELTGLSRPSVADLVERLTAQGLIEVVGEAGAQRRGPNAKLHGIVSGLAHLAALDVRTEGVTLTVADLVGTVLAEASAPIDDEGGTGPAVERAVALVERTAKEAGAEPLHTVGIGAPGLVDPVTGELRDSSGLPEWHRRLVAALHERLPARVLVENETNLAALAEQRDGAARDRDTFALLWLGHGIGAAVVLDGVLRRGPPAALARSASCPCRARPDSRPRPGVTEASTRWPDPPPSPNSPTPTAWWTRRPHREPAAAALVREAVRAEPGTPAARFLDALAGRLVLGAASVVAVLDPGCLVLGGEVGRAGGDRLATLVATRLAAMSPLPTEVRAGALGGAAVLRGALLMARDGAQDDLFAPTDR